MINKISKTKYYKYAQDVLSGKVLACKWVKLACQRFLDDLKNDKFYFSTPDANHIIDFFTFLRHIKGQWAGNPIILEPWEEFIVANLFGFKLGKAKNAHRRFRTAFISVGRKNGKSSLLSGIGLYCVWADGEAGAEVYSAATTREQARLIFDIAKEMVRKSDLKNYISIFQYTLVIESTASKFAPLSSDYNSLDGLNISAALVDELHAHKNRGLYDILLTATAARRQPLTISITTAGYDKHSICWEQNRHTEKVLERRYEDDTHFGIVYTLDEKDNWEDSNLWIKANPNLNISVKLDDLQGKGKNAKETPAQLNAFLRKHLNLWTESVTRWISSDKWDVCSLDYTETNLKGRLCYAGLDLSTTTDISALVLLFPPIEEDEKYKILCRFWIPADNIQDRVRKDKVPYDVWARQKYIVTTPGNVIDYSYILKQIDDDAKQFDLREIAFDRWGSTKIMNDLQNMGFEEETVKHAQRHLIDFGQGFASMSAPTKELEKLILSKNIAHNNNPVLTWMISNVAIKQDPAGNVKPDKGASTYRIDGVVALIMAVDRSSRNTNLNSVYDEREMVIL